MILVLLCEHMWCWYRVAKPTEEGELPVEVPPSDCADLACAWLGLALLNALHGAKTEAFVACEKALSIANDNNLVSSCMIAF